jgi:hypothetical protein
LGEEVATTRGVILDLASSLGTRRQVESAACNYCARSNNAGHCAGRIAHRAGAR